MPNTSDESRYTFYDILPGKSAPQPAPLAKVQEVWWLQVAAFRGATEAEALKARLILLDLKAAVQSAEVAGATMYRVRVGPFAQENAAQQAREALTANNFEPRLLKEPVTP